MTNKPNPKIANLQRLLYILLVLGMTIAFLVVGKIVLVPLVFAAILALALTPVCNWLEGFGINRVLSIVLTYLGITILATLVLVLVSVAFASVFKELPEIKAQLEQGLIRLNENLHEFVNLDNYNLEEYLEENSSKILTPAWNFIEGLFNASLLAIGQLFLTFLYTFFILLYRKGIKTVLTKGRTEKGRNHLTDLFSEIQEAVKSYAGGLLIVMLILGILNSTGLWIIGIKYAFFWGFLAGFMIIVPYIGTTLGGAFPFLYALATTATLWQPVAIVLMYLAIQNIEGNFITPNIVGSKISVNPMAVIVAMICGGLIWGIAGMILAMPLVGILKVILSHFDTTRNLGYLLSDELRHLE
jgi:predicted PurR-regulated permease PerM